MLKFAYIAPIAMQKWAIMMTHLVRKTTQTGMKEARQEIQAWVKSRRNLVNQRIIKDHIGLFVEFIFVAL